MKPAVFIERDGLLNRLLVERRQPRSPLSLEEFQINQAVVEPLQAIQAAGFMLIATTNQPGLSRGTLRRHELDHMHALLQRTFNLDGILLCPHDENDACPCRKPKPGLLLEAAFKWHLDLEHCFVVSEMWQDAQAAHVAGCTSLLIRSPWNGSGHHDFVLEELADLPAKLRQLRALQQPEFAVCEAV
ncbi:MAG: HAD-IIIA family hydrolase [Verrucomicrobia bacterium]|nr:HAD-IIIA family hydrolase [Verrucomicrobiota bacterium]